MTGEIFMNILKFYTYIFYRFKKYYDKWQAIMSFITVIAFNFMSILFLYLSITHTNVSDNPFFLHDKNDYLGDRFYILVVDVFPLFSILYIIYRVNKKKIEVYFKEFDEESDDIRKKRNRGRILYFVFTVLFFIFSVVSSSFF